MKDVPISFSKGFGNVEKKRWKIGRFPYPIFGIIPSHEKARALRLSPKALATSLSKILMSQQLESFRAVEGK
jgi:hypothetical protein